MSSTLIVLDTQVDPLWQNALPELSPKGNSSAHDRPQIIDLNTNNSNAPHPYYNDPVSWRRWLDKHLIDKVHLFLPGNRSHILRTFACGAVKTNLHITGPLEQSVLKSLALTQDHGANIFCAGQFIARQLEQAGIDACKITVEIPVVSSIPTSADRCRQIRSQLQNGKTGPVLLALNCPQNATALKQLIWAVTLVAHLIPQMTLVIAGACSNTEKNRILNWQHIMDVAHTVHVKRDNFLWNELVDSCDAIIAGPPLANEAIRLLSARTLKQHIIAPQGCYDEYLSGYPKSHYASSAEPRPVAQTLVRFLDNKKLI